MAICGYLVIPEEGAGGPVFDRLSSLPGCDVARAENRDVLVLVTETPGPGEEEALRRTLTEVPGVRALILTFGEIG